MTTLHPLLPGDLKTRRRIIYFATVFLLTSLATWVMADILWRGGINTHKLIMLGLFIVLFMLISMGFVQALIGFILLWRGRDPARMTDLLHRPGDMPELPVTAVVLPIFNENVSHVYEGLRVIYRSVERTGQLSRFDFFILSDSTDPNKWIEEETAWVELCKQVRGFGRIFYRKRKMPLNRKSGNISDFCRRWGSQYRYMIILDADSIMTGESLVNLARLMEMHPQAGIIQAVPVQVLGESFFARFMQFAGTAYGPVFQAGLNFWQANDGNYWGHNAIIRVAPFMAHCALPDLPAGVTPRAKFISHDYVEAALMRRAGFEVWLAYGLTGSYEGGPPSLIDHAKRDKRWCRGNLQHRWLMMSPSFPAANRLHLFQGVMSFVASPLWLFFMVLGTAQFYIAGHLVPRAFDSDIGLSPWLDIGGERLAILLAVSTLLMLFIPKLLSLLLILRDGARARSFGGRLHAAGSVLLEHGVSMLMAPILMLFHARFVLSVLTEQEVSWGGQRRGGQDGIDWGEALVTHFTHTLTGIAWGLLAWWIDAAFFWWMSPIVTGLILSIPLSVLVSRTSTGRWLRRRGLFVTPHEAEPPKELANLKIHLAACEQHVLPLEPLRPHFGFMQVVLDPYVNAVHLSLLRKNKKYRRPGTAFFEALQERVICQGPDTLNRREQMALLQNPECMAWLHEQIWLRPPGDTAPWWRMALKQYNILAAKPQTALHT